MMDLFKFTINIAADEVYGHTLDGLRGEIVRTLCDNLECELVFTSNAVSSSLPLDIEYEPDNSEEVLSQCREALEALSPAVKNKEESCSTPNTN